MDNRRRQPHSATSNRPSDDLLFHLSHLLNPLPEDDISPLPEDDVINRVVSVPDSKDMEAEALLSHFFFIGLVYLAIYLLIVY